MIEWIDYRSKQYTVFGMKGPIKSVPELLKRVETVSKEHNIQVQLVNASKVYGKEHLEIAAEKAITNFDLKWNKANSLPVEVLLHAAVRRQISEAMEFMGIKEGDWDLGAVALTELNNLTPPKDIAPHLGHEQDDSVLEPGSDVILDELGVDPLLRMMFPREEWGNLVIERITMFHIDR